MVVILRFFALEFKAKRSSRAVRMATAENLNIRAIQPQKSSGQTGCLTSLPTHIQESKKLIKRNGETVEIVTLTLASGPKLVHDVDLKSSESESGNLEEHGLNESSTSLLVTQTPDNVGVVSINSTVANNLSNSENTEQETSDFLIINSEASDFPSNNAQDKVTFITTDGATTSGNEIVTLPTQSEDGNAGTSGMSSQHMSIVQMVETSNLPGKSNAVIAGHPNTITSSNTIDGN